MLSSLRRVLQRICELVGLVITLRAVERPDRRLAFRAAEPLTPAATTPEQRCASVVSSAAPALSCHPRYGAAHAFCALRSRSASHTTPSHKDSDWFDAREGPHRRRGELAVLSLPTRKTPKHAAWRRPLLQPWHARRRLRVRAYVGQTQERM